MSEEDDGEGSAPGTPSSVMSKAKSSMGSALESLMRRSSALMNLPMARRRCNVDGEQGAGAAAPGALPSAAALASVGLYLLLYCLWGKHSKRRPRNPSAVKTFRKRLDLDSGSEAEQLARVRTVGLERRWFFSKDDPAVFTDRRRREQEDVKKGRLRPSMSTKTRELPAK
ncbi:hypothetical protein CYMTET_15874 [Cymbomonas tetramitiformis]|uniref:Transmembrane protein n=1 Tax=Cymbomonas tetramitiformis TaxID=36881 RepID=A0AAE0L8H6_9CHLO|nr:hypothetical protein CYMTET_15874 [Cymbomonas tetramitiformis]